MPTNLQKAQKNRLRVVEYYSNGWEFIIRLLMGLGIYVVLRIVLMSYLTYAQGIEFAFANTLAELMVLLVSALLMLFFIWFKGSRSHLMAALWLPAVLCLVFVDIIHFIQLLLHANITDALLAYLPFILPLFLILIYWVFDPESLGLRIFATLLILGMSIFWINDIPKSLNEAKNVQAVLIAYQSFAENLQEDHLVQWKDAPKSLQIGNVQSSWQIKNVDPSDYKIADDLQKVRDMYYVFENDIIISGIRSELKQSSQELKFDTLKDISLHYFYKYLTTRKIILKDFQYSGNAFFLLEYENGEKLIADNVLIRKK